MTFLKTVGMRTRRHRIGAAFFVAGAALLGALLGASPAAAQAPFPRGGRMIWSGTVDDTTVVTLHRGDVNTRVASGKSSSDVNAQVVGQLPDRPVRVALAPRSGRGRIEIVQQPNPRNDFTARVRIHDSQGGSSFYRFVLSWGRRGPRPFATGGRAFRGAGGPF